MASTRRNTANTARSTQRAEFSSVVVLFNHDVFNTPCVFLRLSDMQVLEYRSSSPRLRWRIRSLTRAAAIVWTNNRRTLCLNNHRFTITSTRTTMIRPSHPHVPLSPLLSPFLPVVPLGRLAQIAPSVCASFLPPWCYVCLWHSQR
jgi:hypothetical protein